MAHPPISEFPSATKWLSQFNSADRAAAASLLDAMVLLNEEQVSRAIREQIYELCKMRKGKHRRMALYAEREFSTAAAFQSELKPDRNGKIRMRAVGRTAAAVRPIRGGSRVGSEGWVSFIISQAQEAWPNTIMNHPGPDLIRGKTSPPGTMVIVTDFIGSGSRVRAMLDVFWAVPSVRAWHSRKYIDFKIIAAAATMDGMAAIRKHRVKPDVLVQSVVPTIRTFPDWKKSSEWLSLINRYGPDAGRGASRYGFGGQGALVALSYRLPNNTPALIHNSSEVWHALYVGPAPDDLRPAFGIRTEAEMLASAAEATGVSFADRLTPADASLVLILSLMRGRWRNGKEIALAERTGLSVPDVWGILRRALKQRLLTPSGRLTDAGQSTLAAGRKNERRRPDIPTNPEPYYPTQLRTPRGPSSTRRPPGRP